MNTALWPSSWKARIRWSGMPRPTWMSREVTSIPGLTRSRRPDLSFASTPPSGRTSTAFRVRSAIPKAPSLEVGDLERLKLVRRLEAEDLADEGERRLERAPHVLTLAEAVPFAGEGDVRVRN